MERKNLCLTWPDLVQSTRIGQKMELLRESDEVGERIANLSHEVVQSTSLEERSWNVL